jgi:hypothetical protein
MTDSFDSLRAKAQAAVQALASYAAATTPGALLPRGPAAQACRAAVRAVLTDNRAPELPRFAHEQCVAYFLRQKLLPPVQWIHISWRAHVDQVVAVFVGVVGRTPLTVDLRRFHDRVEVRVNGVLVTQTTQPYYRRPMQLQQCSAPVAMVVFACFCVLLHTSPFWNPYKADLPAKLQAANMFYDAVVAAKGPKDVWNAVAQAVPRGMCGATVMPWRSAAHVTCAKDDRGELLPGAKTVQAKASLLWVLQATGAKPGTLLRAAGTTLWSSSIPLSLAAVGLLACGNPSRNVWCDKPCYPWSAFSKFLGGVREAWPDYGLSFDELVFTRMAAWRPARAAWCV